MSGRLVRGLAERDPARFAQLLEAANDPAAAAVALGELPGGVACGVATRLPLATGSGILARIPDVTLGRWLGEAPTDSAARLLARIPAERRGPLIAGLESRRRRFALERLLGYPPGSVGALLQTDLVTVPDSFDSYAIALELQRHSAAADAPVIVVTEQGAVAGVVDLKRVLGDSDGTRSVKDCFIPVTPLVADMPVSAAVDRRDWMIHSSLPLVDYQGRLLGYVTRAAVFAAHAPGAAALSPLGTVTELALRFIEVLTQLSIMLFGGRSGR